MSLLYFVFYLGRSQQVWLHEPSTSMKMTRKNGFSSHYISVDYLLFLEDLCWRGY